MVMSDHDASIAMVMSDQDALQNYYSLNQHSVIQSTTQLLLMWLVLV